MTDALDPAPCLPAASPASPASPTSAWSAPRRDDAPPAREDEAGPGTPRRSRGVSVSAMLGRPRRPSDGQPESRRPQQGRGKRALVGRRRPARRHQRRRRVVGVL